MGKSQTPQSDEKQISISSPLTIIPEALAHGSWEVKASNVWGC